VVTFVQDPPPNLGCHVGLGPADQRDLPGLDVGQDAVHGGTGPAQSLHLVGVLNHPQWRRDLRGPGERQGGTRCAEVD